MDMIEIKKKVSEKGYMSLSKEEKDFFQANKAVAPKQADPVQADDIITISKKDLDGVIKTLVGKEMEAYRNSNSTLQEQVKGLESTAGLRDWQVWKDPIKANKVATFRLYQEDGNSERGLIVDRKFLKNEYDENSRDYDRPMYEISVLYADGKTKKYTIPLILLTQLSEMETVEIMEMKVQKVFKSYGIVTKTATDGKGYKLYKGGDGDVMAVQSDDEVDAIVTMDVGTCVCKRIDGQIFEVDITRLNCA